MKNLLIVIALIASSSIASAKTDLSTNVSKSKIVKSESKTDIGGDEKDKYRPKP